jgi:uroporphyrin-III C-methyltransferase
VRLFADIIKDIELRIARKFPGNADRAQEELMHAAVEGAQQGKIVVRVRNIYNLIGQKL